jgi:hypothetical protein
MILARFWPNNYLVLRNNQSICKQLAMAAQTFAFIICMKSTIALTTVSSPIDVFSIR